MPSSARGASGTRRRSATGTAWLFKEVSRRRCAPEGAAVRSRLGQSRPGVKPVGKVGLRNRAIALPVRSDLEPGAERSAALAERSR
jgi:hypothetical protein